MAVRDEVRRLTEAYRRKQIRDAAKVAALVAAYYRSKRVVVEDPDSVQRWIDLMVPRVLATSDATATSASVYATALRRLEVPNEKAITLDRAPGSSPEQIERSLRVVGPETYLRKMRQISERDDITDLQREALEKRAAEAAVTKIAGTTVRHAQAGGRSTLQSVPVQDKVAVGFVRVTRAKPCYFCAMLASRGTVYSEDSFDDSDPRFTGEGDSKAHDSCQCSMKPVYNLKDDPYVDKSKEFERMWLEFSGGKGGPLLAFRQGYEGRIPK